MKYQFVDYPAENGFNEKVLQTRSMQVVSWSAIARNLADFSFRYLGPERQIVHDNSLIGGYYRNADGTKTVAVKIL